MSVRMERGLFSWMFCLAALVSGSYKCMYKYCVSSHHPFLTYNWTRAAHKNSTIIIFYVVCLQEKLDDILFINELGVSHQYWKIKRTFTHFMRMKDHHISISVLPFCRHCIGVVYLKNEIRQCRHIFGSWTASLCHGSVHVPCDHIHCRYLDSTNFQWVQNIPTI